MRRLTALLLALPLFLSACAPTAQEPPPGQETYGLWFAVSQNGGRSESSAVVREERTWEKEPSARELMEALLAGPQSDGLYAPFPGGVSVRQISYDEGGSLLRVDLSEQYGGLAGFDLTLADYCIALTLSQLPGVTSVEVLVDGQTIPYRDRQELQAGDVLLSGTAAESEAFLAALHFPRTDGAGLAAEYRQVKRSGAAAAEIVLAELLRGPSDREECLPLPADTQVLGLTVTDGLCQVDLSAEFLTNAPRDEKQASLTLYSLVNSLCALGGISQVRILMEGEPLTGYGSLSINTPLNANFDLIQD